VSTVVDHVVPGGIADHAGVQVGRHLWAVDDERVWIAGAWHGERYVPEGRDLLVRIGKIRPLLGPGPAERPAHPHGEAH
jgi:hypothetical protein